MRQFSLPCLFSFLVLLTGCTSTEPPVGPAANWPPQRFARVRAFAYHCDAEPGRDFIKPDGRYHGGILKPGGVELSPDQVRRLLSAINQPKPKSWRTPCYVPHHAFVFYDPQGRRIANLDLCFTCNKHRAFPDGIVDYPDMPSLFALVQQLGLPTGTGKYFYRDLYLQQ